MSQIENEERDKYKFVASFDMRNSFVIGHSVKFNGVKIGLGNSKQRLGIGIHFLRSPIVTTSNKVDVNDATDTNRYGLGYFSLYYERIIFQSKRWEFTAPIHFNVGAIKGEYLNNNGKYVQFLDQGITALTISVKSHYKIYRWVGLSAGLGYNQVLGNDKRTQKALNAPFYSFGLKVFLGETWKLLTNKKYRKSDWD